ncbi:hypothetical protein M8C21_027844, partial [Ambrosia artemisiifolia]
LQCDDILVPHSIFGGHRETKHRKSFAFGFDQWRRYMERYGCARVQLVALVDPYWQFDYIQDGSTISKDMDRLAAYNKGMSTWGKWVDLNVDPSKTKVFFQGISPTHYMGKEWGSSSRNCYGELQPIEGSSYPAGLPEAQVVLNRVLSSIKKPVTLLDITTLSQLRKDAHPSTYSDTGVDCSHWCVPGLPDTWNQLMYASFLK